MIRSFAALAAVLSFLPSAAPVVAQPRSADEVYKIVTASARGTYIQIGRDLAAHVGPAAGLSLEALTSAGAAENVRRLRFEPGVKMALVQSDVYQSFLDLAAGGNASAAQLISPLRVILPLYDEEITFVVRADSPMNALHDIEGARINAGEVGSGAALTTLALYRQMFGKGLPEDETTYLGNEEALIRLIDDQSIDVVAFVAGQPAKLLANMKPEAREHIKILKFDADAAASKAALQTYFPATVRATSYPNLLDEDLPALATTSCAFARGLCEQFPTLREKGHPKWQEIQLTLSALGRGWSYYAPTARELERCTKTGSATPAAPPAAAPARAGCSTQERILGLCSRP